ncbi:GNAT family N-acetyltransferase [Paenibacillus sp. NRS-1775]|uniref:GNAT family N-acetyltransferase n=1 Tax=unclassified Paenibacillus TaxID=185978 RepID=UPI003D2CBDFD
MKDFPTSKTNNLIHKIISIDDLPQLKKFRCGNGSMDLFLETEAYPSHIERESSTTLVYIDTKLVGYYTLRHINLSSLYADITPEVEIGVLDIARLAVDRGFQEKGIGKEIVNNIFRMAIQLNERFIVLDAIKEKWTWYKDNFEFDNLFEDDLADNSDIVTMIADLYDKDLVERYYDA